MFENLIKAVAETVVSPEAKEKMIRETIERSLRDIMAEKGYKSQDDFMVTIQPDNVQGAFRMFIYERPKGKPIEFYREIKLAEILKEKEEE